MWISHVAVCFFNTNNTFSYTNYHYRYSLTWKPLLSMSNSLFFAVGRGYPLLIVSISFHFDAQEPTTVTRTTRHENEWQALAFDIANGALAT